MGENRPQLFLFGSSACAGPKWHVLLEKRKEITGKFFITYSDFRFQETYFLRHLSKWEEGKMLHLLPTFSRAPERIEDDGGEKVWSTAPWGEERRA